MRGSRQARAMGKATKFGRKEAETAWKNTEADALYQLVDAGVHVPTPRGYFHGVLLMDLVTDEAGHSAPRLGEVELEPEQARVFHASLIGDVVKMLSLGLVHGDLSEYNVLVSPEGPVVIDFPQVVSAAGNNAARDMLLRDVHNLRDCLGRFAPDLLETHYGEEMWALFERARCVRIACSPGASSSTPAAPTCAPFVPRSKMRARKTSSASKAAKRLRKTRTKAPASRLRQPSGAQAAAHSPRCSAANIRPARGVHAPSLTDLRVALWPHCPGRLQLWIATPTVVTWSRRPDLSTSPPSGVAHVIQPPEPVRTIPSACVV